MRKSIVLLPLLICISGFAQLTTPLANTDLPLPYHEVGIGFTSTTNFSLRYEWGIDQMLYRITLASLGASTSADNTTENYSNPNPGNGVGTTYQPSSSTPLNLSLGLNFSMAKIKSINEKFGFMFGTLVGFNITMLQQKTVYQYLLAPAGVQAPYKYEKETRNASYAPFIGALIGVRYKINSSFYLFAEIAPNISYTYATSKISNPFGWYPPGNTSSTTNTFALSGLSNSGATLTIAYRF